MNRASVQRLMARGAAKRAAVWGDFTGETPVTISYQDGQTSTTSFTGYFSAIRSRRERDEKMLMAEFDFTLRFLKSQVAFTPASGGIVTIASRRYRVAEVQSHPTDPEWICGMERVSS